MIISTNRREFMINLLATTAVTTLTRIYPYNVVMTMEYTVDQQDIDYFDPLEDMLGVKAAEDQRVLRILQQQLTDQLNENDL